MPEYRKQLIEVALPLEAIKREAADEKSIWHRYTSRCTCTDRSARRLALPKLVVISVVIRLWQSLNRHID